MALLAATTVGSAQIGCASLFDAVPRDHRPGRPDIAPSFQLTHPTLPEPDPEQASLFSPAGVPVRDWLESEAVRDRVGVLLAAAHVPGSHLRAYADYLCDGTLVDPGLVVWLGAPGRLLRWEGLVEGFDADGDGLQAAWNRAMALLSYAREVRQWPRAAMLALKRQRPVGRAFDIAMFPPLPDRLGEFRHALLALALRTRALLYSEFASPTRVSRGEGWCVVDVLGAFGVHFDYQRRFISVSVRSANSFGFPRYAQVDLLEPLRTEDWCRAFANRLRQDLRTALGWAWPHADIEAPAFAWLTSVVQTIAARSRLLERVRRRISDAYPYNRQVVRDLREATIDLRRGRGLLGGDYMWAWRHAEILRQRVGEAPRLAPLWGLAVRLKLIGVRDDFHALRRLLTERGVTTAGWKLLCRWSRALFRPLDRPNASLQVAWDDLIAHVRLLQRAQAVVPMPYCIVRALFARHWYTDELDVGGLPLGLVRGAIEQVRGPLPLGALDAFIDHELTPVLGWIARARPVFDRNQQRAPWRWFHARCIEWTERERQRRQMIDWTHGINGLRWRRFDVVPLRDSAMLWQEGEAMRTCLSTYADDCRGRLYIIYSVRAGGRPRPVAHIGLHLGEDGTGRLDQVRGFANSAVEPALVEFAKGLARMGHFGEGLEAGE
ncbi:PcfJ domain-containing protein [Dokdonella immobilis]|uniref:PcfJ-like protein n=1 Tax=Dokdonella immobilis TaxID=578942 RepID=A0A1I4ZVD9_9GAMM|nr:PcfJ domain-containing protein [Dokdonella immobilis]SFN54147.1 PcfJ-like protein [Dokdonella immobilis]